MPSQTKAPVSLTRSATSTSGTWTSTALWLAGSSQIQIEFDEEVQSETWLFQYEFDPLPSDATITGFSLDFQRNHDGVEGLITDHLIELYFNDEAVGTNKSGADEWQVGDITVGGASDLWGLTGNYNEDFLYDPACGVLVRCYDEYGGGPSSDFAFIDIGSMGMTVHYNDGATTDHRYRGETDTDHRYEFFKDTDHRREPKVWIFP